MAVELYDNVFYTSATDNMCEWCRETFGPPANQRWNFTRIPGTSLYTLGIYNTNDIVLFKLTWGEFDDIVPLWGEDG